MRRSLLGLSWFALACAPAADNSQVQQMGAANDPAAVRSAIEAQIAGFERALISGDTAALLDAYTNDAIIFPANQKAVRARAERSAFNAGMLGAMTVTAADITTDDLIVTGDYAIETGSYTMTMKPKAGGKAMADTGKFLAVWQKQADGSWKMIRDAFTTDLPAPK